MGWMGCHRGMIQIYWSEVGIYENRMDVQHTCVLWLFANSELFHRADIKQSHSLVMRNASNQITVRWPDVSRKRTKSKYMSRFLGPRILPGCLYCRTRVALSWDAIGHTQCPIHDLKRLSTNRRWFEGTGIPVRTRSSRSPRCALLSHR